MKTQALFMSLVVGLAGLGACGGGGSPAPATPTNQAAADAPVPAFSLAGLGFLDGVRAIEAKACECTDKACLATVQDAVPAWFAAIQASNPAVPPGSNVVITMDYSFDRIEACWAPIEAGATLTHDGQPWRNEVVSEGFMVLMRGSRNTLCACQDMVCVETAQETMMKEMMAAADRLSDATVSREMQAEGEQLAKEIQTCVETIATGSGAE